MYGIPHNSTALKISVWLGIYTHSSWSNTCATHLSLAWGLDGWYLSEWTKHLDPSTHTVTHTYNTHKHWHADKHNRVSVDQFTSTDQETSILHRAVSKHLMSKSMLFSVGDIDKCFRRFEICNKNNCKATTYPLFSAYWLSMLYCCVYQTFIINLKLKI